MPESKLGPTTPTFVGPSFSLGMELWLWLALRRAHQIIRDFALPRRFLPGQAFDLAEALLDSHQVRAPLRVEILHDLGEPQREFALLPPPLALIDERTHLRQQGASVHVAARRDALDARGCRRRHLAEIGPQLHLE